MVWANRKLCFLLVAFSLLVFLGCQSKNPTGSDSGVDMGIFQDQAFQDRPIGLTPSEPADNYDMGDPVFNSEPLKDFNFKSEANFRRISLDDVIQSALSNSQVVRDLGGTILQTPDLIRAAEDPALVYTDPTQGEEAALSAFDAQFNSQFLYQNVDRAFNSTFVGDQGIFRQDLLTHNVGLSKRSATGASYRLDGQLIYDRNNTISNQFADDTAYDTFLQAEVRQPLLQGAGVQFNRIAGPNNLPGVNNGVLIARANTDIGLAEFEVAMRNLVSDVENAYWDLYFAYRDLEAKIEARNGAYQIWQRLKNNSKGASEIAQSKEQYYRFAGDVQDAIHGRLNDGTRTNNGSSSGTFRANGGVRVAERRLRLISGLPLNDTQLIVPADMPVEAKVVFDWMQAKDDALIHRTELRRQRWVIKRECLELTANRNFLLPRVDLVSRYRLRGFGNDLYGSNGFDVASAGVGQDGTDAIATMLNGDFQEWELGFDVNIPIGFRRQNAAVRNSLLSIQRERSILKEQQRQVVYGLSNAMGELDRTMGLLEINRNRLDASEKQFEVIKNEQQNDRTTIDLVLESQRRVIDSKRSYFQTQVEFMLAVKAVHFEKGTLLGYHNVALTESGWENQEYEQAQRRETMKSAPLNFAIPGMHVGNPASSELAQGTVGDAGTVVPAPTNDVGGEVFEVADTSTKKGQVEFADAAKFLNRVYHRKKDVGTLRSMALEVDQQEKADEQVRRPFKSLVDRVSESKEDRELNKSLDEKPIFDVRTKKSVQNKSSGSKILTSMSDTKIGDTKSDQVGEFAKSLNLRTGSPIGAGLQANLVPIGVGVRDATNSQSSATPVVPMVVRKHSPLNPKPMERSNGQSIKLSDSKKIETPVVITQATVGQKLVPLTNAKTKLGIKKDSATGKLDVRNAVRWQTVPAKTPDSVRQVAGTSRRVRGGALNPKSSKKKSNQKPLASQTTNLATSATVAGPTKRDQKPKRGPQKIEVKQKVSTKNPSANMGTKPKIEPAKSKQPDGAKTSLTKSAKTTAKRTAKTTAKTSITKVAKTESAPRLPGIKPSNLKGRKRELPIVELRVHSEASPAPEKKSLKPFSKQENSSRRRNSKKSKEMLPQSSPNQHPNVKEGGESTTSAKLRKPESAGKSVKTSKAQSKSESSENRSSSRRSR